MCPEMHMNKIYHILLQVNYAKDHNHVPINAHEQNISLF